MQTLYRTAAFGVSASIGLYLAPAFAQSLQELNAQTAEEGASLEPPAGSDGEDAGVDEGPDELTALSRRADDPFPDMVQDANRRPIDVTVRALNKVTAKYEDITIGMDGVARFGTLEIVARHCDKRPPEEFPETTAFLQIFDRGYDKDALEKAKKPDFGGHAAIDTGAKIANAESTDGPAATIVSGELTHSAVNPAARLYGDGPKAEGAQVFSGWMFASSPALNPLEHPVYDVWVIDCQTETVEEE